MLGSIRQQLESRHSTFNLGELDRVLAVMRAIDREKFVPPPQRQFAYLPMSLDIGFCQTLSDAYIIALTVAAAHIGLHDNVLDVGTGSGYQAAILSRLAEYVQSVEIIPQLADRARKRLKHLGYHNVEVATADGFAGWPRRAPFDAILVSAGATSVPPPLIQQLKPGGRLIMPIGETILEEELVLVTKSKTGAVTQCTLGLAAFVPMTGQAQRTPPKFARGSSARPLKKLPLCYAVPVT
jgi:protein-L-isoaspartate(D-aspartate) O-methyltransferase